MENIKFRAGQGKSINLYKNRRFKLLKSCTNIYFNKQCLSKTVIPSYANIKFQETSPVAQFVSKKAQTTHIKDEIRFSFKKKDKQNREHYEHQLKAAKEWAECGKLFLIP